MPDSVNLMPLRLLYADIVQAQPGERYARAYRTNWTFEYVLDGEGWLTLNDETVTLEAGDVYILPKALAHEYAADLEDPWRKAYFVIDGPLIESLIDRYGLTESYVFRHTEAENIFAQMQDAWNRQDPAMHDRAALLLHELIQSMARERTPKAIRYSPATEKALGFIRQNLETPVTIEQIATAAHQSRSHLSRVFKKEVGLAPYEFLIHERIELARRLLLCTPLPVSTIADRLCYADAYYFSNAFKQHVGVAPSTFREQAHV